MQNKKPNLTATSTVDLTGACKCIHLLTGKPDTIVMFQAFSGQSLCKPLASPFGAPEAR